MSNSKISLVYYPYLNPRSFHFNSDEDYIQVGIEYMKKNFHNDSKESLRFRDMYYSKIKKTQEYYDECNKKYAVLFVLFYCDHSLINYTTIKVPSFYDYIIIDDKVNEALNKFYDKPIDYNNSNLYKNKELYADVYLQYYYDSDYIRVIASRYLKHSTFGAFQRYENNQWQGYKDFSDREFICSCGKCTESDKKFYNIFSDKIDDMKLPNDKYINGNNCIVLF